MRFSSCIPAVVLVLTLGAVSAQALTITHTQPRKMESTAFTRLGEFFGVRSNDSTRVVVFSNTRTHAGLFFEVELDTPIGEVPPGSTALLELFTKGDRASRNFNFEIPRTISNAKALYLGLTDAPFATDCRSVDAENKIALMAWKITIMDKDRNVLAISFSPLWQH